MLIRILKKRFYDFLKYFGSIVYGIICNELMNSKLKK